MMFAIVQKDNTISAAWTFPRPPEFVPTSPMAVTGCQQILITATRLYDGYTVTGWLHYGTSGYDTISRGIYCSMGCGSGPTGMVCLTTGGGESDFPAYYGYTTYVYDHCFGSASTTTDSYPGTVCGATQLFAIYVR
eukprot:TRINITY_DN1104_c0_g1_i1.p2 TRINITY_DN1104_c0_g1~~TRINITY_DN1104_c0_g1_i1.p2  ORF type:complete len:136 (-),score=5.00 TRINITY_DN1104_c0_g1_i1:39-446(-)